MGTFYEHDDDLPHGDCGCGQCEVQDDFWLDDEEDVYDDPYEVVMYDIDSEPDDLYALIEMLGDSARSWYASRRINSLAASGLLSNLVAAIIIDSLGRRWNPLLHPRDRFGRFIETGGFIRWLMSGVNLRGQVSRIDSDGNIHVRSVGNDRIPDGSIVKFKPEQASKLISIANPKAGLSDGDGLPEIDLDADIPDFPEASTTQKRIYNTLQQGDMPAEDLDRAIDTEDLSGVDFAAEVLGLQERGLIDIDRSGDKPRVRRNDDDGAGVINIDDSEIDEIPDDETPDLEDSPALTKPQRDLLDRIVDADRGEDDGVGRDELDDVDDADLQALIDSGALEENEDGRLFLENPEGGAAPEGAAPADGDLTMEIFDAAAERLDDIDAQEAFQHYAEELARPGDENNAPLPENIPPAKRRNAEALAQAWWEERNVETPVDEAVLDQREEDNFADEGPDPKDVLNPRNQALADTLMDEEFPGEEFAEFLESDIGVEYAGAVKRLFDAEDLEENGFDAQAATERDKANRTFRRLEIPEEDIEGWPLAVQNMRNADREQPVLDEAVDVPEDVLPEEALDEVVPNEAPVALEDRPSYALYSREHPRAQELLDEGASEYEWGYEGALLDLDAGLDPMSREDANSMWGTPYQQGYFDGVADRNVGGDVVPEEAVDVPESAPEDQLPEEGVTIEPDTRQRWQDYDAMLAEEGPADDFYSRLEQEARIAEELGLDHFSDDAPWSWQNMSENVGYRVAELMFNDNDGRIGKAGAADLDKYERQYEDELLQKFMDNDNLGPEVLRLRRAGLVEDNGMGDWTLTQAGRDRLGIVDEPSVVETPGEPSVLEETPGAESFDAPPPSGVWDVEQMNKAVEVLEAMKNAQNGVILPGEAYEVAARAVGGGWLEQRDIDFIQDQAKKDLGDDWDFNREIDFVGSQRGPDGVDSLAEGAPDVGKPTSDHPVLDRLANQRPFDIGEFPGVTEEGQGLVDQDGLPVQIGNWYKARAGGEGDPGELVGFYDQNAYPGWMLVRAPDGKHKAVHVYGRGGRGAAGGMRRISPDRLGTELNDWRAQRRAEAGIEVGILDELNARNKMFDGVPAEVGMRVENRIRGKNDKLGDRDGIVARVVLDKDGNVKVFVLVPGAENERQLIEKRVNMLRRREPTPAPPTPEPPSAPEAAPDIDLPDGAENALEGEFLNKIDAAGPAGLRRSELLRADDDDILEQFDALREMVERGVLERVLDDENRPMYRRVPQATPAPELPLGAQNEQEADLLNIIDGAGEGGVAGGDLIDIDETEAADKMVALRGLVRRGVLRKEEGSDGRATYRRSTPASNAPTPMTDDEAVEALRNGVDPQLIANPNMSRHMQDAGYASMLNKNHGISQDNYWRVSPNAAAFPVTLKGYGEQSGHIYMDKASSRRIKDDVMNEVIAGAISQNLSDSLGRDTPGLLYHPKVSFGKFPTGVGLSAGGSVLMDHAAYGYPPGHEFFNGRGVTDQDILDGNASSSVIRMGLYDYLINNGQDRHTGNQMFVKNPATGEIEVVIIDNGFGFGAVESTFRRGTSFSNFINDSWNTKSLVSRADRSDRASVEQAVRDFVSAYEQLDVEATMNHIRSLFPTISPEQENYARTWLTEAKTRVDALAVDIDAVVDTIMGL